MFWIGLGVGLVIGVLGTVFLGPLVMWFAGYDQF